eukprot:gene34732-46630_t
MATALPTFRFEKLGEHMRIWQLRAGARSLDDLAMVEQDKPSPGPGQVLIRVHACSLNYRDQMIVQGHYFGGAVDRDITPLSDGAGVVEAVGPGVVGTKPGDRVAGTFFQNWRAGPPVPNPGVALGAVPAPGMLSEYVVLPEHGIVRIAESLSFEEAATLPCAGVTAWNALMEGPRAVGPGRSVLLLGTGGVSLLALSIAKAAGARVIATSSSDEKLARIRALGADATINYTTHALPNGFRDAIKAATDGKGPDVIYDPVGGDFAEPAFRSIGWRGRYLVVGFASGPIPSLPLNLTLLKGASLVGVFWGDFAKREPKANAQMMAELAQWYGQGKIKPGVAGLHRLGGVDIDHGRLHPLHDGGIGQPQFGARGRNPALLRHSSVHTGRQQGSTHSERGGGSARQEKGAPGPDAAIPHHLEQRNPPLPRPAPAIRKASSQSSRSDSIATCANNLTFQQLTYDD